MAAWADEDKPWGWRANSQYEEQTAEEKVVRDPGLRGNRARERQEQQNNKPLGGTVMPLTDKGKPLNGLKREVTVSGYCKDMGTQNT